MASNETPEPGNIGITLRQIMDETGVSRMPDGQPLYTGAYRSGLATFVRKVIDERESTGWIKIADRVIDMPYIFGGVCFGAWLVGRFQ